MVSIPYEFIYIVIIIGVVTIIGVAGSLELLLLVTLTSRINLE